MTEGTTTIHRASMARYEVMSMVALAEGKIE